MKNIQQREASLQPPPALQLRIILRFTPPILSIVYTCLELTDALKFSALNPATHAAWIKTLENQPLIRTLESKTTYKEAPLEEPRYFPRRAESPHFRYFLPSLYRLNIASSLASSPEQRTKIEQESLNKLKQRLEWLVYLLVLG